MFNLFNIINFTLFCVYNFVITPPYYISKYFYPNILNDIQTYKNEETTYHKAYGRRRITYLL